MVVPSKRVTKPTHKGAATVLCFGNLGTSSLRYCTYTDSRPAVLHYCCKSPASGHVFLGLHHVWHDLFYPGTCDRTEVWQLIFPGLTVTPGHASTCTWIFQAPLISITLTV